MNITTKLSAIAFAAVFSSASFASESDDLKRYDVLYGSGVKGSTESEPYTGVYPRPVGLENDVLYNIDRYDPRSAPVSYERVDDDRDNSQDLLSS